MDTKIDVPQAFDDLQAVLNHMYTLANKFYAKAQVARQVCDEKDRIIADLKADCEKKFAELQSTLRQKDEQFTAHLKEYGDYNVNLTRQLEDFHNELTARARALDDRENELNQREETLAADRHTLDEERRIFDAEKFDLQAKVSGYDELKSRADDFDAEKRKIRDEYRGKISELETQHTTDTETIEQLQSDKNTLNDTVKNLYGQIENLNQKINQLTSRQLNLPYPNQHGVGNHENLL